MSDSALVPTHIDLCVCLIYFHRRLYGMQLFPETYYGVDGRPSSKTRTIKGSLGRGSRRSRPPCAQRLRGARHAHVDPRAVVARDSAG